MTSQLVLVDIPAATLFKKTIWRSDPLQLQKAKERYKNDPEWREQVKRKARERYRLNLKGAKDKAKKYYEQNSHRVKAGYDDYRVRLKREVIDAYGGKCACCGETGFEFLTVDHVNGDGAEERAVGIGSGVQLWMHVRDLGFPKQYQILCFNCNCAKRQNPVCPHKTEKNKEKYAKLIFERVNGKPVGGI